ncbi:CAP domain-containing protein [Gallaecimonas sp. GXIMD4217]|uniref:CAP domain-containing protein n=1 Tax=Gallaecimonas sp. GXIMD4217 TaxID=3131927 RepID=UPI00311B2D9A
MTLASWLLTAALATVNGSPCELNPQEQQLAKILTGSAEQRRPQLTCNPLLAKAARERARMLAEAGEVSHRLPDGRGPNQYLRELGYPLWSLFSGFNQVEAVAGGYDTAADAFEHFTFSGSHRPLVLGEDPYFLQQDEFGVGYHYRWQSPHVHYWVLILARRDEVEDKEKGGR